MSAYDEFKASIDRHEVAMLSFNGMMTDLVEAAKSPNPQQQMTAAFLTMQITGKIGEARAWVAQGLALLVVHKANGLMDEVSQEDYDDLVRRLQEHDATYVRRSQELIEALKS